MNKDKIEDINIQTDIIKKRYSRPRRSLSVLRGRMCKNGIILSPVSGRNAVNTLKGAGEVELIGISNGIGDLPYGIPCQAQELCRFDHTVMNQELLR